MNWKQHLAIGLLFISPLILFLYFYFQLPNTFIFYGLFIGLFSSLLPDIDHKRSKIHRWIKTILFIVITITAFDYFNTGNQLNALLTSVGTAFIITTALTFFKPRHRGITHSMIALVLLGALTYYFLGSLLAIVTALGYFSHLLADLELKLI